MKDFRLYNINGEPVTNETTEAFKSMLTEETPDQERMAAAINDLVKLLKNEQKKVYLTLGETEKVDGEEKPKFYAEYAITTIPLGTNGMYTNPNPNPTIGGYYKLRDCTDKTEVIDGLNSTAEVIFSTIEEWSKKSGRTK